jgi:uncharacterized UPF0160 family protein
MSIRRLVTHWGRFHADEVFATAVLMRLYPLAELIRTRDKGFIDEANQDVSTIIYDVGGQYEPDRNCFDHHQFLLRVRPGDGFVEAREARRENGVPFAAFGLVWKHFGAAYVLQVTQRANTDEQVRAHIQACVDAGLVEGVDAGDCGALEQAARLRLDPCHRVQLFGLSELIADMNPGPLDDETQAFGRAVAWADGVLLGRVRAAERAWFAAREVQRHDTGDAILVLSEGIAWPGYTLPHHRLVIYPERGRSSWLVQSVPSEGDPLIPLCPFPESWAGLRGHAMQEHTGVGDAEFCHAGRFIVGAGSQQGALQLAKLALQWRLEETAPGPGL